MNYRTNYQRVAIIDYVAAIDHVTNFCDKTEKQRASLKSEGAIHTDAARLKIKTFYQLSYIVNNND